MRTASQNTPESFSGVEEESDDEEAFELVAGFAFESWDNPNDRSYGGYHFYVCLTDCADDPENILIINLTSIKDLNPNNPAYDKTVEFLAKDKAHDYITVDSIPMYVAAHTESEAHIRYRIASDGRIWEPVSSDMLRRLRCALMKSRKTKGKIKRLCKDLFEDKYAKYLEVNSGLKPHQPQKRPSIPVSRRGR